MRSSSRTQSSRARWPASCGPDWLCRPSWRARGSATDPGRWSEILFGRVPQPVPGSERPHPDVPRHEPRRAGRTARTRRRSTTESQVDWPDAGTQRPYPRANRILRRFARVLGGTFVPNPAWSKRMGRRLLTVHPLGGAVMADDAAAQASWTTQGRVFTGRTGERDAPGALGGGRLDGPDAARHQSAVHDLGPGRAHEHVSSSSRWRAGWTSPGGTGRQVRQDEPLEEAGDGESDGRVPLP